MPTPLDLIRDPVSLALFALYAGLLAYEALAPAQQLPRVRGWWARGLASFAAYFLISSYLPIVLAPWLAPLHLIDASALGSLAGGLCVLFIYQLLAYAYHRAIHRSDRLFRAFHQMHHSAERLDAWGAFWFSPLDMLGFSLVATLAAAPIGVTPGATTCFVLSAGWLSIFQHANVRTPRWLGYVVQRPESHSHHHARSVHRDNYADLPLIDLLFGTFVNPPEFAAAHGYYDGASARVLEMLVARDVSTPLPAASSHPSPRLAARDEVTP